ncbi:hypothetical protein ACW9HH_36400 [Nocardia gipuzkoensis]
MQQQQQTSPAPGRFQLDPAAVATYSAAMGRVADQLTTAAGKLDSAAATAQLRAELGEVGADFAADLGRVLDAHGREWAFGAHLVGEYDKVMTSFASIAQTIDDEIATAIRRGGGR